MMKKLLYILLLMPFVSNGQTLIRQAQILHLSDSLLSRIKYTDTARNRYMSTKFYTDSVDATKQGNISLTTTGTSGAATLIGNTLNIPQYAAGSGISSLNTLTASSQTFATGTSGTDFNISSSTSTHTFNIPDANGTNRGALTSANYTNFLAGYNDKINSASFTAGQLTLTQQDAGTVTATINDATTSVKGVASFSSGNFSVSSGAVSVATGGIGATELAATAVSAGSCTSCNLTIDADGRITAQASGSSGGSGVVFTQTADASVTNSTTETNIIGTGTGSLTIGANTLASANKFTIRAGGTFVVPASPTGTVTVRVKMGSTTLASAVFDVSAGNFQASTTSSWEMDFVGVVRTTGASGTIMPTGYVCFLGAYLDPNFPITGRLNNSGTAVTINTTTTQAVTVTFQYSTAQSGKTTTGKNAVVANYQ
jgi:hypothetical protein